MQTEKNNIQEYLNQVTHQLKTPLTTIHLYSEALQSESIGPLTKEQKEYVSEIYNASERMIGLMNDLRNQHLQNK